MRLLGAIFDMDGVLLDSNYIWRDLGSRYLRSQGKEPEANLERFLQPMTMEDTAAYFRTHYQVARTEAEIVRDMTDSIREEYLFHAPAKPGVDKMLSLLKMSGVTMYVATATDRPLAEAALKRTDLMRYFKGIMTCAEAGASKTQPLIYEKCLTRLRCDKQHCLVFEDSLHAIQTASHAGFRVAAVYDAASADVQEEIRALSEYQIISYEDWFEQSGTFS
jgi:HAD superfamily hydrolase (TIGR01509 family)